MRLLKVFNVPDSRMVSGISFHTVAAACRKARRLKLVLRGGMCNSCWLAERMLRDGVYGWRRRCRYVGWPVESQLRGGDMGSLKEHDKHNS